MARRVNTTFLAVLGVLLLGLMLSVLLAKKFLIKEPQKFISTGTEMMEKGNYQDAAKSFNRALRWIRKTPKPGSALAMPSTNFPASIPT